MIRAGSGDPCEDLPLLNLCNLLCFIRPGQVVRGQWARRGISAIYKKSGEIMGKSINSHILMTFRGKSTFLIEIVPRDPSEPLIFLRNYWCFHSWGAAGVENPWSSLKYREFSGILWNFVNLSKIPKNTKIWFWEVRGRKRAPEPIKTTGITAVFTRLRKGATSM